MAVTRCTYLRINGARCTMPAVNGKDLCFEHESRLLRLRQKASLPSTFATVPLVRFVYPEDHDAILDNVHSIARALGNSEINDRTASVMDRLMNTALRTLRQKHKIEQTASEAERARDFRLDSDGNPRACDSAPETLSAAPVFEPTTEAPEPTTIATISAQAEESGESDQQSPELRRITNAQNLSALLSTLAQGRKLKNLLSNTYIFSNGRLIAASARHRLSQPEDTDRRATAYFFLTNMR